MKICMTCHHTLEDHAEVGGELDHTFILDEKHFDWDIIAALMYSKFGHLSKKEREEKGIWFGDGKQ